MRKITFRTLNYIIISQPGRNFPKGDFQVFRRIGTADWQVQNADLADLAEVIIFRVRHGRGEMYIGHVRLCVCLCVCLSPHSHTTARTQM